MNECAFEKWQHFPTSKHSYLWLWNDRSKVFGFVLGSAYVSNKPSIILIKSHFDNLLFILLPNALLASPQLNDSKRSLVDIHEIAAVVPQTTAITTFCLDHEICSVYVKQISDFNRSSTASSQPFRYILFHSIPFFWPLKRSTQRQKK